MDWPKKLPFEPPTPTSAGFLQREVSSVIHCVIGFKNPINVEAFKSALQSSILQIPRFHSVAVLDTKNGNFRGWKRIPHVDLDRHVITLRAPLNENSEDDETEAVNGYVADLSLSSSMNADHPLWEVHVLEAHRCVILRAHHSLGDGMSLMSMLWSCFGGRGEEVHRKTEAPTATREKKMTWKDCVWDLGFKLKFRVEFLLKSLWVSDPKTAVSGGAGTELLPRKIATATFLIEDMKLIKFAVPKATINDVLFAIISTGLSRYLDHQSPKGLPERLHVTCQCAANLRKKSGLMDPSDMMEGNSSSGWGNQVGIILLPVDCNKAKTNPLEYLKSAKLILDRKKQSREAHFTYTMWKLAISCLGDKFGSVLYYRLLCNTTFFFSNMIGPPEEIAIAGNPVTYLRASLSGFPHTLIMHLLSYAGKANLQISVAKDIIPDPEFLAQFFENALLEMKEATLAATKSK